MTYLTGSSATRIPRALHPIAWWIWAIGLAVAASRTTNPLLLLLILAVLGLVVTARRTSAPWARAFGYYLALAGIVIVIRIVFRVVFATPASVGDHVLLHLPTQVVPRVQRSLVVRLHPGAGQRRGRHGAPSGSRGRSSRQTDSRWATTNPMASLMEIM